MSLGGMGGDGTGRQGCGMLWRWGSQRGEFVLESNSEGAYVVNSVVC